MFHEGGAAMSKGQVRVVTAAAAMVALALAADLTSAYLWANPVPTCPQTEATDLIKQWCHVQQTSCSDTQAQDELVCPTWCDEEFVQFPTCISTAANTGCDTVKANCWRLWDCIWDEDSKPPCKRSLTAQPWQQEDKYVTASCPNP
jgi:hypothetical protein